MEQNDYLSLSEDGKTVISCRWDYEGTVVIPDGVTEIGDWAFSGCTSLTSITIPASVDTLGDFAFHGCSNLVELHLKGRVPTGLSVSMCDIDESEITLFTPESVEDVCEYEPIVRYFKKVVIEK